MGNIPIATISVKDVKPLHRLDRDPKVSQDPEIDILVGITENTEKNQSEITNALIMYMRECQDKSIISRIFTNNNSCTNAKINLMRVIVKNTNTLPFRPELKTRLTLLEKDFDSVLSKN